MKRNGTSLEQKQRWMREKHQPSHRLPDPTFAPFTERHFSVEEVSEMWGLSRDTVRKLFRKEPGVLAIGDQGSSHRRRYTTLRIPASVLQRVHRRLSNI